MPICFLKRLRKRAKKELEKASEKANLECDILSQTADKTASVLLTGLYKGSPFKTVAMKEAW